MLPQAFNAWGVVFTTPQRCVSYIIGRLYRGQATPQQPQSDKIASKDERNANIRSEYAAGSTLAELAERYGISEQRIHQIIHGKRK